MRATSLAWSLVSPARCGLCGARCNPGEGACERCRRELARLTPPPGPAPAGVDAIWAAAPYRGAARALVRGLKFGRMLALARVAAAEVACAPPELLRGTLVPVPAAPLRGRWRGFDPAEEISCRLAALTGVPLERCLRRTQGPRQVGRARAARLASPPRVRIAGTPPRRAILVDDVVTTGATVAACAAALREGGCERVVALTFARSPKRLGGTARWD